MKILYVVLAFVAFNPSHASAQASDAEDFALAKEYFDQHGLDAMVELQVKETQKNLPLQSSQLEQIVGVTYLRSSRTQVLRHVTDADWRKIAAKMSNVSPEQIEQHMPALLQQQTVNLACSVPFTKLLMERGLTIRHNYYEPDGRFLFHTQVDASSCPKSTGAGPNNSFKPNPLRGSA